MAKEKRFEKVHSDGAMSGSEIWVDTQTGVQYFFHASGYAGGMCVLVDAEGKPLLHRSAPEAPEY
ncbi:MAG: xylan 1,4-beta-xylosidase [Oscillospiraceae bacterium]|nr:xylan 1,4-beta-xylosidase [Oscillospiraceae bacterium]